MKFFILVLLAGCATTQAPTHWDEVFKLQQNQINEALAHNPVAYGSIITGTRYIQLHDMVLDNSARAGVAIIEARDDDKNLIGHIFIYTFCSAEGICKPIQVKYKLLIEK